MGDLFTSSQTTNSVRKTDVPKNYQSGLNDLLAMGKSAANDPFAAYTDQRVANFDPAEQQALDALSNNFNQYDPLIQAVNQSQLSMIQHGGTPTGTDISGLMDPYIQQVLGLSQDRLKDQYESLLTDIGSRAGQSQAFGGTRQGVLEGAAGSEFLKTGNQLYYGGMSDAWNNAVNNWFRGQDNSRANNTTGVNVALGGTNRNINNANALAALGGQRRDLSQANLDFAYQQFQQQQQYPWQQTMNYGNLLYGYPRDIFTQHNNTTQTSTPSTGSVIMGGAMMAAGAFSGNPNAIKEGENLVKGPPMNSVEPNFNTGYIPFSGLDPITGSYGGGGASYGKTPGGKKGGLVKHFAMGGPISSPMQSFFSNMQSGGGNLPWMNSPQMQNNPMLQFMMQRMQGGPQGNPGMRPPGPSPWMNNGLPQQNLPGFPGMGMGQFQRQDQQPMFNPQNGPNALRPQGTMGSNLITPQQYKKGGRVKKFDKGGPTTQEQFAPREQDRQATLDRLAQYNGSVANVPELGNDEVRSFYAKMFGAESQGGKNLKNSKSTAGGPYQFIQSTADDGLKALGYTAANRKLLLANGTNGLPRPIADSLYNNWFFPKMVQRVQSSGMPLNEMNLYLAHHYGDKEMKNIYSAMQNNPDAKIEDIVSDKTFKANKPELGGRTAQDYHNFLTGNRQFLDRRASNITGAFPSGPLQMSSDVLEGRSNNALNGNIGNYAASIPFDQNLNSRPVVPGDPKRSNTARDTIGDGDLFATVGEAALGGVGTLARNAGEGLAGLLAPSWATNDTPSWVDQENQKELFRQQEMQQALARRRRTGIPTSNTKSIEQLFNLRQPASAQQGNYLDSLIMNPRQSKTDVQIPSFTDPGMEQDMTSAPQEIGPIANNLSMIMPYFARNAGATPKPKPTKAQRTTKKPAGNDLLDDDSRAFARYMMAHPEMIGKPIPPGSYKTGGRVRYDSGGFVDNYITPLPQEGNATRGEDWMNMFANWGTLPERMLTSLGKAGYDATQGQGPIGDFAAYMNQPGKYPYPLPGPTPSGIGTNKLPRSPLEQAAQENSGLPAEAVNQMSGDTPESDMQGMMQDIINQRLEEMKAQQQEKQAPLFGLFEHANVPLMRAGLALLANSNKNFGEALGTAGLQEMGMEEKERTDAVKERNDQLKDVFNMRYMQAQMQALDPNIRDQLARKKYERDIKLQQMKQDNAMVIAKFMAQNKMDIANLPWDALQRMNSSSDETPAD